MQSLDVTKREWVVIQLSWTREGFESKAESLIRFGCVSVLALLEISRPENRKRGEKKRKDA
jgi:hypothetical protein